jgi:phosphotransferase system enzyme I (PtsI)
MDELWYDGVAASPGIAIAEALPLESSELEVEERSIAEADVPAEIERFKAAVESARQDLLALKETTADTLGDEEASVFDAHLSILADPMAYDETIKDLRSERKNAEFLYRRNLGRVVEMLESHNDAYFAERAQDIRDVKRRVIRRLLDAAVPERAVDWTGRGIVVAHEISPSDAAILDPARVLGLAVDIGGRTSHVAIMARSRGIPAVMGLKNLSSEIKPGTIVLDGFRGRVICNPRPDTLDDYRRRQIRHREAEEKSAALASLPATTLDGRPLTLAANMEMPEEADTILKRGAMGVGLFRTEFFFMRHHRFPTEAEQFTAYRGVVEKMAPHPVIIRTLDVGGDKFASYLGASSEDNPFLGMRGIRFLSEQVELFHDQLRAAYRASAFGRVKILLPMVSRLEEIRETRALCASIQADLAKEGIAFDPHVELGVMIEVPSAVILSDLLAKEADFFSIGSNDLIQYTLAVDRGSARMSPLYEPLHPAVLRSIRFIVTSGHNERRWVGICGEMAADPTAAVLLVGLGIDEISVGAFLLPEVKRIVRQVRYSDARKWAAEALKLGTAREVREMMDPIMQQHFPELVGMGAEAANGAGSPIAKTGGALGAEGISPP